MKPDSLAPDRLTQVGSMELSGRSRQDNAVSAMLRYQMQHKEKRRCKRPDRRRKRDAAQRLFPALLVTALANQNSYSGYLLQ
jgi:U3 small nucleolar ribonucleoprotein component